MKGHGNLFSKGCDSYAKFRRSYPKDLFDTLFNFGNHDSSLAVDVATGTGQVITPLATRFSRVVGVDSSKEQINHAVQGPNVSYHVGTAEEFKSVASLASNSVDLVTVAMGLHWFDLDMFYKECRKALKTNGTFAAWSYGLWMHPSNAQATEAMKDLYTNVLGPYWKKPVEECQNGYMNLVPSTDHFLTSKRVILDEKVRLTMQQSLGYLSTWSAYNEYRLQNSDDPLIPYYEKTMKSLNLENDDEEFEVDWPIALILAKDPVPIDGA